MHSWDEPPGMDRPVHPPPAYPSDPCKKMQIKNRHGSSNKIIIAHKHLKFFFIFKFLFLNFLSNIAIFTRQDPFLRKIIPPIQALNQQRYHYRTR
jgi:hypothetical protein